MSIYYVDAQIGNDSNDGLSTSTALKSLTKVNALLAAKNIDRGDTLALKGGQDHYGSISSIPAGTASQPPLVVTTYGSAERARINTYKVTNIASSWSLYSTNIWRIDLTAAAGAGGGFIGNISSNNVAVGFLKVDGVIRPKMRNTLALLSSQSPAQWNFYSDNAQYLYVYSTANPTTLAADINVAIRENIFTGQTKVTLANVELLGSGAHGYRISGTINGASDIEISNCYIHEIGGSRLYPADASNFTRFGNGVEFWINLSHALVEGNTISDVYDVAFTCQGGSYATGTNNWSDITVRGNTIYNCNQSFEFWSALENNPTSPIGFSRVKLTENTCFNAGYSWGQTVRGDNAGKATHLLTYNMQLPTDIEIANNIFWVAFQNYSYHSQGTGGQDYRIVAGFNSHDNVIVMQPNGLLQFPKPTVPGGNAYTIENAAAWQTYANTEKGSKFVILPTDINIDTLQSPLAKVEAIYAYLSSNAHLSTVRSEYAFNAAQRALGRVSALDAQVQAIIARLDAMS